MVNFRSFFGMDKRQHMVAERMGVRDDWRIDRGCGAPPTLILFMSTDFA